MWLNTKSADVGGDLISDGDVIKEEHAEISLRRARKLRGKLAGAGGESDIAEINPKALEQNVRNLSKESEATDPENEGIYDLLGVSLSGGGVRSAAFCMGALQALAKYGILDRTDYLSTVSGGGYAGLAASLSYAKTGAFGFFKYSEPQDTPAMAVLRDRANYLKPNDPSAIWQSIAIILRGWAANVLIVAPMLLLLAAITLYFNPHHSALAAPDLFGWEVKPIFGHFTVSAVMALVTLAYFAVWAVFVSMLYRRGLYTVSLVLGCVILGLTLLAAFFELQTFLVLKMIGERPMPQVATCTMADIKLYCRDSLPGSPAICPMDQLSFVCQQARQNSQADTATAVLGGGGGMLVKYLIGVLASVSAVLTFFSKQIANLLGSDENKPGVLGWVKSFLQSKAIWIAAGLALPLALWLVYLLLVYWGVNLSSTIDGGAAPMRSVTEWLLWIASHLPRGYGEVWGLYAIAGLVLTGLAMFLSANGNSLHRLYRDRLGEAFCFVKVDGVDKPQSCDNLKLSELGGNGPYHLINTALNIASDKKVNQRGRNADFFMFSQKFIGSRATKFARTKDIEQTNGGQRLDIATAMAVSGAAISSNMGTATMKLLRLTLAFFNVRLGYWFVNPRVVQGNGVKPMYLYFLLEALGRLNSDRDRVYLSDGGHVENLGLYELLKRRCKVIIAVDGEADPGIDFNSLVTAERYARIDLGAKLDLSFTHLQKTARSAQKDSSVRSSGPHCMLGKILYQNGENGVPLEGYLLYVKSSVTGDENDYVRDYNRRHVDFPHQSTSDQFFSEEQFEVYRALGFHALDQAMSGKDFVEDYDGKLSVLTARNATNQGIKETAEFLQLPLTDSEPEIFNPTINHVKLVPEEAKPYPIDLTIKNMDQLTSALQLSKAPVRRVARSKVKQKSKQGV